MNGSSKDKVLSIENVEFVVKDESKRRSSSKKNKKGVRRRSGSDELVLLGTPPPLMDDEEQQQGETNPLLGTSTRGTYGMASTSSSRYHHPQQQSQPPYPEQFYGRYDYGYQQQQGQHPPSPPPGYPPVMMNMPPHAMYQYYDQMGGGVPMVHPMAAQQQQQQLSPQHQMQYSPYNDTSTGQRRNRSSKSKQSPASSPPPQQIRKSYPDTSPTATEVGADQHPLKRSPTTAPRAAVDGSDEYEIPLRDPAAQRLSYGTAEKTTPPRGGAKSSSIPFRRKSDTSPTSLRPPSPLTRSHRRISSDGKFGGGGGGGGGGRRQHRRINSEKVRFVDPHVTENGQHQHRRSSSDKLPPVGRASVRRNLNPFPLARGRSYSGSDHGTGKHAKRPSHSRTGSLSEISLATSASMVSHVSDISKSAFFGGTTETGKVQLHFPFENVRLTMDDTLPPGTLYMRHVDDEQYEDYHILNDEHLVPWELDGDLPCMCTCAKCVGCTERGQQLAPNHYIMTVKDDLYRRIFDEISDSRECCFFCGHHEDVSHPSILIPVTIVTVFMILMGVAAVMTSS